MCVVVDAIKTNQDVKILGEWRRGPRHDLLYRRLHRSIKTNQPLTQTGGLSLIELSELKNWVCVKIRVPFAWYHTDCLCWNWFGEVNALHWPTAVLHVQGFKPLFFSGLSLVPLWRRPHSLRLSTIENPVRPGLRLPAFSHMEQSLEGEQLRNKNER